jgi:hypothetical protein
VPNSRKPFLIGAAAFVAAGALFAGVGAFTASNTQPSSQIVGYGVTTSSGATVTSLAFNLSSDGSNVDGVTVVLAGDTTASNVSIGFDGNATTSCGTGTFAASATTYTCDNGGSAFVQPTAGLDSTAIVVN